MLNRYLLKIPVKSNIGRERERERGGGREGGRKRERERNVARGLMDKISEHERRM